MSTKFVDAIDNITETDNGAVTNKSSLNDLVDLFYTIGLKYNPKSDFEKKIVRSYKESPDMTLRTLMYGRDILKGTARRDTFINGVKILVGKKLLSTNMLLKLLRHNVSNGIGYYKDWINLYNEIENKQFRNQTITEFASICKRIANGKIEVPFYERNLLKWMPRSGSIFNLTRSRLKMNPKQFRKLLTSQPTVEQLLCGRKFDEVDFSKVPGKAMTLYKKAFSKRMPERFVEYLQSLVKTSTTDKLVTKMNVNTMSVDQLSYANGNSESYVEAVFAQMKNNLMDKDLSAIVVADTSYSMMQYNGPKVTLRDMAVAMAALFGSLLKGPFHNTCMSFSQNAYFHRWEDSTPFKDIQRQVATGDCSNTDVQKVFNLILNTGIDNQLADEDMPKMVILVSDMQFDQTANGWDNIKLMRKKFEDAGYTVPTVVFWNMSSEYKNTPLKGFEHGILMSGYSQNLWDTLVSQELENYSPINYVKSVLSNERYSIV